MRPRAASGAGYRSHTATGKAGPGPQCALLRHALAGFERTTGGQWNYEPLWLVQIPLQVWLLAGGACLVRRAVRRCRVLDAEPLSTAATRPRARRSTSSCSSADPARRPLLDALARESDSLARRGIVHALRTWGDDSAVRAALSEAARSGSVPDAVRHEAQQANPTTILGRRALLGIVRHVGNDDQTALTRAVAAARLAQGFGDDAEVRTMLLAMFEHDRAWQVRHDIAHYVSLELVHGAQRQGREDFRAACARVRRSDPSAVVREAARVAWKQCARLDGSAAR